VLAGKLPPRMFGMFMQQMRLRMIRRLPIAFGWLTMRGDAATARWMKPVMRALRAAAADTHLLLAAAECLPGFDRPALVVWASGDRVMPPEHGRRLAELLPNGQLAEIDDSYILIPLDQPDSLRSSGSSPTHPTQPSGHAGTELNLCWTTPKLFDGDPPPMRPRCPRRAMFC
jgi:pimeloyl-ACP methyl ester carboxylesterase